MEQFFTYIELVTNMCKFLNCEEQFKLTQVSSVLENIIVNYVWNKKFDKIEITMMGMSFVVSDTLKEYKDVRDNFLERGIWRRNGFILTSKKLKFLLNLNINNIKKLQLIEHNRNSYGYIKNALPFRKKFPNLTELKCWKIEFEEMDLQQIAVNCAKLETLVLGYCRDLNGRFSIGLGNDIQILKAMHNLNNLCICGGKYTFSIIKNIFNQLKLQQLKLKGAIVNDSENINNDLNLRNLKYYNELNMSEFNDDSDFLHFQTNLLPHFENLCNLSLRSVDYILIENSFFNVLLKSCKSLTHLDLSGFIIRSFIALPSLIELNLEECHDLTYSHLRTILSEMHLKCFKSRRTEYKGDFVCYFISPSLKNIDINSDDNNLKMLLEFNIRNLMNLTELTCSGRQKLSVSNFAKNLQVLNIEEFGLFDEDCLNLKYLQEITLNNVDGIAITDFLLLLKHTNLRKLSFKYISYSSDKKSLALKELKNLHTNLRYLQMLSYNRELISDILLDLLNINTKLSFACVTFEVNSIIDTVIDEKFPKRFKNIQLFGVAIDCNSIRNKCEDTMSQMENLIKYSTHMYIDFLLQ